jgi:hypothetical protein
VFGKSGSTFGVCLVNLTEGILVVGNLGDSHVLLAEDHPNGWEVVSFLSFSQTDGANATAETHHEST